MSDSVPSRSVIISFIRNMDKPDLDDSISITPSSKSMTLFNVTYRDKLNTVINKSTCVETEVLDFVDNFMHLLPIDQDPFSYIQLTAPSFPPVLIRRETLYNPDTRNSVRSVISNTLRNWPSVAHMPSRPVTRSQTRAGVTSATA
jgi:hypothetical protein